MNPFLIKLAVRLALKPENLKRLLKLLAGILAAVILLPAIMLMTISTLFDDGLINDSFDITQTELYSKVAPVYEQYMDEIRTEMQAEADRIIEENTTTDTDPDTGEETSECDVNVEVVVNDPGICTLLAYLSLTDPEVKSAKKYKADKNKILDFYRTISRVDISCNGDDYTIQNILLTPEQIAALYAPDQSDQSLFLTSYENYRSFLPEDIFIEGTPGQMGEEFDGELVFAANGMEIPLFKQGGGQPWSSLRYGNGTIATSGCGPTAMAMVITYLSGNTVTPDKVIAWTGNRYYLSGKGSTWTLFPACASHWNIQCRDLGKSSSEVVKALSSGQPVIASMDKGTFTKGGHFIVLRGITSDGQILVNDPNDNAKKDHLHKKFPLALIMREGKNFWSFK